MASKVMKENVPVKVKRFIHMEANMCTRAEKLKELFDIDDPKDPELRLKVKAADQQMTRWRKHPLFKEIWNEELSKQDYDDYTASRKRLRELMQSDNGFLAVQAAIQVANNSSKRLFKDEENTVHITFDGMPDLGTPDGDDA